jgi:hypothetical protein
MASGGALVAHILIDVPLWLSAVAAVCIAGAVLVVAASRREEGRVVDRRIIVAALRTAVAALVAYDLTRWAVVRVLGFEVGPFDAFVHFGAGLLGTTGPATAATWVAGALFHVANAIGFGVAYTVVAGHRGVVAGVAFGVGLEAVMLGLYPAWLQIANLREFVTMSMAGHVAYGATLGLVARRGLGRKGAGAWTR